VMPTEREPKVTAAYVPAMLPNLVRITLPKVLLDR